MRESSLHSPDPELGGRAPSPVVERVISFAVVRKGSAIETKDVNGIKPSERLGLRLVHLWSSFSTRLIQTRCSMEHSRGSFLQCRQSFQSLSLITTRLIHFIFVFVHKVCFSPFHLSVNFHKTIIQVRAVPSLCCQLLYVSPDLADVAASHSCTSVSD